MAVKILVLHPYELTAEWLARAIADELEIKEGIDVTVAWTSIPKKPLVEEDQETTAFLRTVVVVSRSILTAGGGHRPEGPGFQPQYIFTEFGKSDPSRGVFEEGDAEGIAAEIARLLQKREG